METGGLVSEGKQGDKENGCQNPEEEAVRHGKRGLLRGGSPEQGGDA